MTFTLVSPPHPDNLESWARDERERRITRLTERGMTAKAAAIVVDAAMFGIGCLEGEVRARIEAQKQKEKHDEPDSQGSARPVEWEQESGDSVLLHAD